MHIREMDFRRDWIAELFHALTTAIENIENKIEEIDWFDGIFALEHTETILGVAFVAAQTYIAGTVADINELLGKSKHLTKRQLLELDGGSINNCVTQMQLIDAVANYYKHHDEWVTWQPDERNRYTISILNKCGITEKTEFPCNSAASLLWPEAELGKFHYLLDIMLHWRKRVFREYAPTHNISLQPTQKPRG